MSFCGMMLELIRLKVGTCFGTLSTPGKTMQACSSVYPVCIAYPVVWYAPCLWCERGVGGTCY